jgi:hypothetical protein
MLIDMIVIPFFLDWQIFVGLDVAFIATIFTTICVSLAKHLTTAETDWFHATVKPFIASGCCCYFYYQY